MIKYLDTQGHEVTLDTLTAEFQLYNELLATLGGKPHTGPLDYEVQQYIQRAIERGDLEIEVWN